MAIITQSKKEKTREDVKKEGPLVEVTIDTVTMEIHVKTTQKWEQNFHIL